MKANQVFIDLSKLLSFEYADRYGNKIVRTAEPYQLVLKSSHWYWQGYCHERNDFRLFKLSRTSNLQILEEWFTPREYHKKCECLEPIHIRTEMKRRILDIAAIYDGIRD